MRVPKVTVKRTRRRKTMVQSLIFGEFLLWLSGLRPRPIIHEDEGLIPGLTQWVKYLALP